MRITTLDSTPLLPPTVHPALPCINQPKALTAIEIYGAFITSIINLLKPNDIYTYIYIYVVPQR